MSRWNMCGCSPVGYGASNAYGATQEMNRMSKPSRIFFKRSIRANGVLGLSLGGLVALTWSCTNDPAPTGATLASAGTGCVGDDCTGAEPNTTCLDGEDCSGTSLSSPGSTGTLGRGLVLDSSPIQVSDAAPPACVDLDVEFERVTPTVVLLIDQSGSMLRNFPQKAGEPSRSRWDTVVHTLANEDGFLKRLSASVRFGMALYTSDKGFGPQGDRVCPQLTQIENIALGSFEDIKELLQDPQNGPDGDTPTAESITAVAEQLAAFTEEGPKSIILATDGEPDTCEIFNPANREEEALTRAAAVSAVTAAHAQGIATRVISVGRDVSLDHLTEVAIAGAGGDTTAQAFQALDTQALENAFNDIIGSVRTCDFELGGTVLLDEAQRGTVVLDGEALQFGDPDGWEMPDEQTLRLLGNACETAQGSAAELTIKFPCGVIELNLR